VRYRQAIRTTRRTGQSRPASRAPNAPGSMNAAARMPEPRLSRINESIMPRGCPKACGCGHYAKRAVFEAAQGRLFRSLPCGQRRSAAGCRQLPCCSSIRSSAVGLSGAASSQNLPLKGGGRRSKASRVGVNSRAAMISKRARQGPDPPPTAFAPAQGRGKCRRPPPCRGRYGVSALRRSNMR
jgi:hypothetical protein